MQLDQIQTVRDTFQSILRADYISISDIKQLENLNDYYVDFFNLLPKILHFHALLRMNCCWTTLRSLLQMV